MQALMIRLIAWFAASPLGKLIANYTIGKIKAYFEERKRVKEVQEKNKEEAAKTVQPLQKAQTAEEIRDATDDALDKF